MEKEKIKGRINQKIEQLNNYLEFLSSRVPSNLEEYKNNLDKKAICERYAQKIIESTIDLAFLIINIKNLRQPAQEDTIFNILSEENIISQELAKRLSEAKGMRNFIIHEYGEIDDEIVFEAVSFQLKEDAEEFMKNILNLLEKIQ